MTPGVCVPKLTGADVELGNFIQGATSETGSAAEAALRLLQEIRHQQGLVRGTAASDGAREDPQDRERTFLSTNGGCAYIDLDHLELCLPETLSAWDHVAWWHAMLCVAREAQRAVNEVAAPGQRIHVLANNSDDNVSYGGHLNIMMSRPAWEGIAHRKPHHAAFLAAFQVSSLPITGQGKVGSANNAPRVMFQLSQRADWFETIAGPQTTYMRPLINTRDEPLCGRWWETRSVLARLHCIFFDTTLCQTATLLRVGTMQLVLAMIEAGLVDADLALDDPLSAVREWSHDPTLEQKARLVDGRSLSALELQRRFWDHVAAFVDAGLAEGVVPRAAEIVALWDDTLTKLEARDWASLARRLDWVLKLGCLERALAQAPRLHWTSPEIRHLDQLYASLDPATGLHWNFAERGLVECVVPERRIEQAVSEPPGDTRARDRAMLQRRVGGALHDVDWDRVRVRLRDPWGMTDIWRVDLTDPLGAGNSTVDGPPVPEDRLGELLYALGATREPSSTGTASAGSVWGGVSRIGAYGGAARPWSRTGNGTIETNPDERGSDGTA